MEYIEDLTKLFASKIQLSNYDERIARSLADQCFANTPFTEKQGMIAVRLIKKYRKQYRYGGIPNIDEIIESPTFKYPFRVVDRRKTAEIITVGEPKRKVIAMRFPYENDLVTKIKKNFESLSASEWDADNKQWLTSLTEENLDLLSNYLIPKGFEVDEELENYIEQHNFIKNNFESFIPLLAKEEGVYKFKNTNFQPEISSFLEAIIASRVYHITVFSDEICQEIENSNFSEEIKKVFAHPENKDFYLSQDKHQMVKSVEIAKIFDTTTAIFLDDNVTPSALESWIDTLIEAGIDLNEVAVLFRQKNEQQGEEFNNIVKKHGLNKPVTENLKWVFLGSKYPKSLVKLNVKPDVCILDNKYFTTHYTLKSIAKNSMLNIFYGAYPPKESDIVTV